MCDVKLIKADISQRGMGAEVFIVILRAAQPAFVGDAASIGHAAAEFVGFAGEDEAYDFGEKLPVIGGFDQIQAASFGPEDVLFLVVEGR